MIIIMILIINEMIMTLMRCRAFVYDGFLTDLECDHLISIAKSELKRSAVADNLSGHSKLSEVRTSSGMFIAKNKVALISLLIFLYLQNSLSLSN